MPFLLKTVLFNFLVPALAALIVVTSAKRTNPPRTRARTFLGTLAVAVGSFSAYAMMGFDPLLPWNAGSTWSSYLRPTTRWVAYLPFVCLPLAALESRGFTRIFQTFVALAIAVASAWLIVPVGVELDLPLPWARCLVAGSILLTMLGLSWLARNSAGRAMAVILVIVTLGASLHLAFAASNKLAQYLAAAAAVLTVAAFTAKSHDDSDWLAGMMPAYAVLLGGWLWLGYFSTSEPIPWHVFLLAALSPLGMAIAYLPGLKLMHDRRRWLISGLGALIPLGLALGLAVAKSTLPEELLNSL